MIDTILHFIKSHDDLYWICTHYWIFFPIAIPLGLLVDEIIDNINAFNETKYHFALILIALILMPMPLSFLFALSN